MIKSPVKLTVSVQAFQTLKVTVRISNIWPPLHIFVPSVLGIIAKNVFILADI